MGDKVMTRENWFDFLWPNYSEIIGEGYDEKPREYPNVFRLLDTDSAYEKYKEVISLPIWEENYEGQPFNAATRAQGFEITLIPRRYDQSFTVTWEYFSDNKEKLMKGKGITDEARMLGRGVRVAQEMVAAEIINGGFTNVGYDGVALFSTSHPLPGTNGDVFANTPATDAEKTLTYENLTKAITALSTQVDGRGIKIQAKPDRLAVSVDLYFTALTIVHSSLVPGNSNNDKNVIDYAAPLTVIPLSYLNTGIWFLQDSTIRNLVFLNREEPIFDHERIPNTYDTRVFGLARFAAGYIDWRGLYGAQVPQD